MKTRTPILIAILIFLFGSQVFALPNLYINGAFQSPVAGQNQDLTAFPNNLAIKFSLLYEITPWRDRNTFGFYSDMGIGAMRTPIFDQRTTSLNVPVGTHTVVDFSGIPQIGFYLFNDLDDDGVFEPGTAPGASNDVFLFSQRGLTLPNPPGSVYQWFRTYATPGYAHYEFYNSEFHLDFYGDYDALMFIDDDHVTGPNKDHNDMVVGMKVVPVPEPTALFLIGLGLAGAGILRRRSK